MKSAILSIIPLVGLAFAQEGCTRRTVTKTETEKTYVTVQPSESTITSTIDITTTITVHPSSKPDASSTALHWGSYPNGTYSNHTGRPQPIISTVSLDYTSSALTETPAPTYAPGQGYGQPSVTSEAAVPTSETPAAVETSSAYETSAAAEPSSTYEAPAAAAETPSANDAPAEVVQGQSANTKRGIASHYPGNVAGGTCSFKGYTIPSSLFGTALATANWDTAANCGTCVSVTGPSGNKITAMIVDECPSCATNQLDLFADGYSKLDASDAGNINVSYDIVPCGITTPLVVKNKDGTSKYWFSMQVINANVAVSKLEVSVDGGKTWSEAGRTDYNFFENHAGYGQDSVDVKVTSTSGQSIIVKDVSTASETSKTAASNFS